MAISSRWTRSNRALPLAGGASFGLSMLAAVLMFTMGAFHVIVGIAAAAGNDSSVFQPANYSYEVDVSTWGWIHVVSGAILILTGIGVFLGRPWGLILGLVVTFLSALGTFALLPSQPIWSLVILAFSALVLWALVAELGETE